MFDTRQNATLFRKTLSVLGEILGTLFGNTPLPNAIPARVHPSDNEDVDFGTASRR